MKLKLLPSAIIVLAGAIAFYYIFYHVPADSEPEQTKMAVLEKISFERSHNNLPERENSLIDTSEILEKWETGAIEPGNWGEHVAGVKNRLDTDEKIIALTFDACGGSYGSGYDEELIEFLKAEEIPATLFFNSRWIEANEATFLELAENPLFSVQNHGSKHVPLSVTGRSAWGIDGTSSVAEVIDEVMKNQQVIKKMTGKSPELFRSGTAHYDEASVQITADLGLTVVNYDILGDAGATFSAEEVEQALLQSGAGSIPLLHMNQPGSGTAEGVINAVPQLIEQGYSFVKLDAGSPLSE